MGRKRNISLDRNKYLLGFCKKSTLMIKIIKLLVKIFISLSSNNLCYYNHNSLLTSRFIREVFIPIQKNLVSFTT